MLEQLDSIDWKSYDAEYMPALIRGLASQDLKTLGEAYSQLDWLLSPYDQGAFENYDVFEIQKRLDAGIPIVVTPFLIELLQIENLMLKDWIVELLYDLSFYHRLKLQTEDQKAQARKIFELVKEALPVYRLLLNEKRSEVRELAEQLIKNLEAGLPT